MTGSFQTNGATIRYKVEGTGQPMLLIHGYPLSGELFAGNRAALARAGYRVITPDLRGFGQSTAPQDNPGSIQAYAQDMLALMDHLGVKQAIIGGMSMGGPIAFEMYRQAPQRFRAMVLITTLANPANLVEKGLWGGMASEAQNYGAKALVDDLIKDMLTGKTQTTQPAKKAFLENIIRQASVIGDVAGAQALADRPDSLPTLKTIKVPTLIIAGGEDTVYPPVFAQKMRQGIAGSKLVVIPGASHAAIYEAAPAANRAILSWARALPAMAGR